MSLDGGMKCSFELCVFLLRRLPPPLSSLAAASHGEEAPGGAPASDSVWADCRELAGKPHPEGVAEGVLLGPSGHPLPGCWPGNCLA